MPKFAAILWLRRFEIKRGFMANSGPPAHADSGHGSPAGQGRTFVNQVRIKALTGPDEWAALGRDLAALGADCVSTNPFYEDWMLMPAIEHLARGAAPRLFVGLTDRPDGSEQLVGAVPLIEVRRAGGMLRLGIRNWVHQHCYLGVPLVSPGSERNFLSALLADLDRRFQAAGYLQLGTMPADDSVTEALRGVCAAEGRTVWETRTWDRAEVRTALSAEDYIQGAVSKKRLKNLQRLQARLRELGDLTVEVMDETSDADAWIDDFRRIEASGWKGAAGSALDHSPRDIDFLRAAAKAARARGRTHFVRMRLDGRTLAMLVNFAAGDGIYCFKTAFDEDFAKFSPGQIIEIEGIRSALARPGFQFMDSCAAPDQQAVNALWGERRRLCTLRVALKGPLNALVFRAARAVGARTFRSG